jgi:hypothetical protein
LPVPATEDQPCTTSFGHRGAPDAARSDHSPLQFAEREQYAVLDEDLIQLDVMTLDDEGAHYKLCELMVSRGDLLRAVAAYGDPPFRRAPVRKDGTRVDTDNAAAGRSAAARTGRTRRPARPDTEQTEL